MEEELWYMKQQSRVLQNFRQDIRLYWDDEAAKKINLTLLNPHQDDDGEMVAGLDQQYGATVNAHRSVAQSSFHAACADQLSAQMNQLLAYAQEDIEVSYAYNEEFRGHLALVNGLLPEIHLLLIRVNSVCDGVSTS